MSRAPFDLSPDLKRLREAGYFVQIRGGLLLVREVPDVDAQKRVRTGTLVSSRSATRSTSGNSRVRDASHCRRHRRSCRLA